MEQKYLGRSGLRVSKLSLGTMTWGGETDEETAAGILRTYVEAGGTVIDTAATYGAGAAEAMIGSMLGGYAARQDMVLVSKAGINQREGVHDVDASSRSLLAALDGSLARLGTDYLDLWLVHAWDARVPLQETLAALDYAVRSGRARYVGISNYAGWQLARAASISPVPLTAVQTEYSLLQRTAEREILPAAAALGLGVLAWSPLGRGVLTGKYKDQIPADSRAASELWASFVGKYLQGRPARITDALITAAHGLNRPALELALGWAVNRPGIDSAVIGPRTVGQLKAQLSARLDEVPPEILTALTDASALN